MRKKNLNKVLVWGVLLLAVSGLAACDQNEEAGEPDPELYNVGEVIDGEVTLTLYAESPLEVGYQPVWIQVDRAGEPLEVSEISLATEMQMESHAHGSPIEQPGTLRDSEHGLYKGALILTMPSGSMGSWSLTMEATFSSGVTATGSVDLNVENSNRVQSFQTSDDTSYLLTWVEPKEQKEGANDLEVTLHKREGMYSFPPVTNADITVTPWMPSMDHGSENNIDPVHDTDGHYKGEVVFNMTGDWEVHLDLEIAGSEPERRTFEFQF